MATNPELFDEDIGDVTGEKGDTGNGISGIELLSTSGLQKTYRINMTDETHFDFVVTDGNGISEASFDPQTNELTITFDDGTSFTTPSLKDAPGNPGDDGVSPAITVTTITGGHRVTITDATHPTGQSFDVMDGASDAGNVTYDSTATYGSGTVGAELTDLNRQLSDVDLHLEELLDTTQAITFDQSGNVQSIVHNRNNTAVRTDVFTFEENTITEVRTLANGHSLTMVTNLTTLETTVTYSEGGNG